MTQFCVEFPDRVRLPLFVAFLLNERCVHLNLSQRSSDLVSVVKTHAVVSYTLNISSTTDPMRGENKTIHTHTHWQKDVDKIALDVHVATARQHFFVYTPSEHIGSDTVAVRCRYSFYYYCYCYTSYNRIKRVSMTSSVQSVLISVRCVCARARVRAYVCVLQTLP